MYVYVHMWYYVYMFLSTGHDQALPFDPKLDELNYIWLWLISNYMCSCGNPAQVHFQN